ncbi:LacI family transcriptional regulator [Streptomyces sp. SAI-133]|uniref:LacI family DNA-binding transcriptional regulator n=1 Tax=unclassified Streptomyces TaxID=2593676 RepID=UPI0024735623|nr:LacI family DNA-binding transcriptional regulator [Streptomyces sp. SAI-133]MDH6583881.1 LacI family transcriptional regulator [Streptomyces sp. SAI-133]
MPTMADVARSAGVSVATVSHVLNGTRPVLPHTRQAVLDAVDELGYTPNTLARSLVTSRTRSIGLAVSAISNPYFTEILQGVEAGALEHGYSLLIADPHDDPGHERKVVQLLHERRVDGMIVAPSADPRELVSYLARHQVPTVFLDRVVDGVSGGSAGGVVGEVAGGSVGAAVGGGAGGVVGGATGEAVGEAAARGTTGEAVSEAATRGTTGEAVSGAATRGTTGHAGGDAVRPANGEAAGGTARGATGEAVGGAGTESAGLGADAPVGGSHRFDQVCAENTEPMAGLVTHLAGLGHRRIGLVAGLPGLSTTAERIAGYRQGLTAARLPYDDHLVVHGNSESAGAERATTALLSLPVPPTALVTANNAMTIGTLRALRTHGLSVPDDLALCCFDDFAWADLFSPRLTAIAQPSREIGARAVRVLLERLDRPDRPARTVRLDCTFVHRTSCGCPDPGEGARPSWSA